MKSSPTPQPAGRRRRRTWFVLGCLAPAILLVAVFTYYPLARGSVMAFQHYNLFDLRDTSYVGWQNFQKVFADPQFWTAMKNTVVWVVGSLVPQFIIGFALALWLRKHFRLRGLYQAFIFFPWAMSGFLIGLLWRWMFNAEFGVINDLLLKTGLIQERIGWLSDPKLAMGSVVVANVWYGVTFFAIMIMAALQTVPDELSEAAAMDGAGKARTLFQIIMPCIRPTLILTILLRIIWIFNFPDLIYGMTGGGPAGSTDIVNTYMLRFVMAGDYGTGSAVGAIAFVLLLMFTLFYLGMTRFGKKEA